MTDMIRLLGEVFHPNEFLKDVIASMGSGVYVVLFLIVFAETGLVVAPILPGDSLLFAAGALAAAGFMDVMVISGVLVAAAILGDAVNYSVGRFFGRKIVNRGSRLVKREYVVQTTEFFEKHGGKAIVLARFVPIVRTFAPFVAGMCQMPLTRFWTFNISGGIVWVTLFVGAGYLFGNLPGVEENLTAVMLGIVAVSVLPMIVEATRHRMRRGKVNRET